MEFRKIVTYTQATSSTMASTMPLFSKFRLTVLLLIAMVLLESFATAGLVDFSRGFY